MSRYRVFLTNVASGSVVVEAKDKDAAIDAAYESDDLPTLCAQCSGWGHDWSLELNDEWEADEDAVELSSDEAES